MLCWRCLRTLTGAVIYYDGAVSVECTAHTPETLLTGMNKFLKQLNITFRCARFFFLF